MHASVADGARERKGDLEDALAAAVVKGTPTGLLKKLKDKFSNWFDRFELLARVLESVQ